MAREALMKRPVTFGRPRLFSTQRPFEDGNLFEKKVPAMFGAEGEDWARIRRAAAPAFSKLNVSVLASVIGEQVDVMLDKMNECADANETFQMDKETFKFANRVISAVIYGSLTGEVATYFFSDDMQNDLNIRFKFLQERAFLAVPRWALAIFDYFNGRPKGMLAYDRFHKNSLKAFAQVKQRPVDERPTLLNNLLRSDLLSDAEVEQNVESFFTAGSDTTASMISWVLFFVVTDPDLFADVRTEIDTCDPTTGVDFVQAANSSALPLLPACFKEAIRLVGVAPFISVATASLTESVTFANGFILDAYTTLEIHVDQIMRDPIVYPDPETYQPRRWIDTDPVQLGEMNKSFIGWGYGPRICPARWLVESEGIALLAAVVRHFDVTLACDKADIRREWHLIAKANKMPVKLTRRYDQ